MKILSCVRAVILPILVLASTMTAVAAAAPPVFVQTVYDVGLKGAFAQALSPDEQFLYVAGHTANAVTVFRRDGSNGRLTFVEVVRDGEGGADALAGADGILVSADGGQVYVIAWRDDALTVFNRNAATGRLTYVETHRNGVGGITTLDGPLGITANADTHHIYVASVHGQITGFSRDPATGRVNLGGATAALGSPFGLAISPDGRHLYVADFNNDRLLRFVRNSGTGALGYLDAMQNGVGGVQGLDGATFVAVSDDNANVYVASAEDNAVAVFRRDVVTGALTFVEAEFDGVNGVDGLANPGMVAVSHDGAHLYAASIDDHAVAIFTRNPGDGGLAYAGMVQNESGGLTQMASPAWITPNQTGGHVYVTAWSYGAVEVFQRDAFSGALTVIEEKSSGDGLEGAVGVAIGATGCAYVTGYDDSAVAIFSRDAATGVLTYANAVTADSLAPLTGAIGVGVSPDGRHIYVAGHDANAVVVFARVECRWLEDVAIYTDVLPSNSLAGARAVAFSPDGALVYIASDVDDAVTIFNRGAVSGQLTFRQAVRDTDAGIDGLNGAYAVTASLDGNNFYVTGYEDDAVATFRWTGGFLSYVGMVKDGVGGVDGLDGANSVVVSPDGGYVYVASRQDDAVAILRRDPATGALTYLGMMQDGVAGVNGLDGARAVAITPDGNQLYVASQHDDALAVFDRNAADGALRFVVAYKDGVNGIDGLATADGIAVSPEGGFVYVAGYDDDAVTVFARFRTYFPLTLR